LAKSTRGESVQVRIDMRLGDEQSLTGRAFEGELVPAMLTRGAGDLDRAEISRRLTALKSTLNVGGSANSVSLTATTDREHLPALLELAPSVLREPTFPESEFEQRRTQMLTGIRNAMTEPEAVASSAMSRYFDRWPEGHPYATMTFEERIQALQATALDEVRAFHRDFYGTAGASIAIVGDVDAGAVQAQVGELFGDWNPRVAFTRIPTPHHTMPAVREQFETPDKANAMLLAQLRVPVGQDHEDYPALVVGNQILGGGSKSRLYDRIR